MKEIDNKNEKRKRSIYSNENKQIAIQTVTKDSENLKWLPEESRGDKDVVLVSISKNGCSLKWASNELQNDKEVVLQAVAQNG